MTEQERLDAEIRIVDASNHCIIYCMVHGLLYAEGMVCFHVTARLMQYMNENPDAPEGETARLGIKWTREELDKIGIKERIQ